MIAPCFTYFSIDIGDIWDFESKLFLNSGDNEQLIAAALEKIRTKIIKNVKPTITYDGSQFSEDSVRYYSSKIERFLIATNLETIVSLGYFVSRDDLYEYGHQILIEKEDADFDYWFALKLRQYDLGLKYINDFLNEHLENSFESNKTVFKEFLELVLLQYEDLPISNKVNLQLQKFIDTFLKEVPETKESKISVKTNKRPRSLGNFNSFKLVALRSNPRYFLTKKHEIKEVFHDLIDYGFIKEKSSFCTFEKIFSNQKVTKDKRLVWVGKYIYLKLFIRFLLTAKKIEPMGNNHWLILTQCFVDEDGKELDIIKVSKANGGTKNRIERLESILSHL